MKNERTPRTLADASFQTGYALAPMQRPVPAANRVYGALLAVCIGIFAALLIVHELAK